MNLAVLKHSCKPGKRFTGLSENYHSAYRSVNAMYDPEKYIPWLMITFLNEGFQKITEGCIAGFIALDDLRRLLVKNNKMIIFEKNIVPD
jgi:hypothetical protein